MPKTKRTVDVQSIPLTTTSKIDSIEIGAQQAYIYLGYTFDAEPSDMTAIRVMNRMLSNQIAFSLREQKGWAYRIGSSISSWKDRLYIYTSMGTGRKTTHQAIQGILNEIEKFKNMTIDDYQVEQTKNSILAAMVRRRASRESQAFTLGLNEFNGYPSNFYFTLHDIIKNVTSEAVTEVRDKYLQIENYRLFYTIPGKASQKMESMQRMPPMMRN